MRSSTSRCLIAALISRITPRRSFSPAFIAAFMSSVSRCFRDMLLSGAGGAGDGFSGAETQKAGHARACRPLAEPQGSVQPLALGDVARDPARLALHGSRGLALALLGRLL